MDFTVTQKGLEEQLLGRVIGKEQKALEEQLSDVLEEVNSNTKVSSPLNMEDSHPYTRSLSLLFLFLVWPKTDYLEQTLK